jgi:hypothetical protein
MNLDFVPQVFYDLISRVVPGIVTALAWYVTLRGPRQAVREIEGILSNDKLSGWGAFALLAVLSYVLGFILRELWSLTFDNLMEDRMKEREKRARLSALAEYGKARTCRQKPDPGLTYEALPATHTMLDEVRRRSPSEGYRLLKLRAEAHLCEGLFVGLVLLPILNVVLWLILPGGRLLDPAVLELLMIVALIALWRAGRRLDKYHHSGTCGAWLALNDPLESGNPADAKTTGQAQAVKPDQKY